MSTQLTATPSLRFALFSSFFPPLLVIIDQIPEEPINPCQPSPCGANAECTVRNSAGACACLPEFYGNPYEGCRPECIMNSDCPLNRACFRNKCQNPCRGLCGTNAECRVTNHLPTCSCFAGHTGDPYNYCSIQRDERKNCYFACSPICFSCISCSIQNLPLVATNM